MGGLVILTGRERRALRHRPLISFDVARPTIQEQRMLWQQTLGVSAVSLNGHVETLVAQFLTAGVELWRKTLADLSLSLSGAANLYERSDVEARRLDGLELRTGVVRGGEPPERVTITENGRFFQVDVRLGHKTGFYLDQRANRRRVDRVVGVPAGRRLTPRPYSVSTSIAPSISWMRMQCSSAQKR